MPRRLALAAFFLPLALWLDRPVLSGVLVSPAAAKAGFLARLLGYVSWPENAFPDPQTPLMIGIAAADDVFARLVEILPGRRVQERSVQARTWVEGDATAGLQMLFVGAASTLVEPPWRERLGDEPTLLVTEHAEGLRLGAALNILDARGRVRFEAQPLAAERAGLKLSARLLALAERVHSPP